MVYLATAESEFEKYRIIQDKLFQSNFDRLVNRLDDEKTAKYYKYIPLEVVRK